MDDGKNYFSPYQIMFNDAQSFHDVQAQRSTYSSMLLQNASPGNDEKYPDQMLQ